MSVQLGVGAFRGQRAALAGTEGTLVELGNFVLRWRTGRVVLEAAGTPQRWFRDRSRFAPPAGGATPDVDGNRHDAGDYRVSTLVQLTPEASPALAVLRFGTRLPTTNNRIGLDRDAIDFFALAGGRLRRGAGWVAAEGGITINGTRSADFEQNDLLAYSLSAGRRGLLSPTFAWVGQTSRVHQRGTERLSELRLGVRLGVRRWIEATAVHGTVPFSPRVGVLLAGGWRW